MPKITTIDRQTHRYVNGRIAATLKELGEELGLKFSEHGGKYGGQSAVFHIEALVIAADGSVETPEARSFKRSAQFYGLSASDLGRVFYYDGQRYRLTGLNTNAPKYPFLAENLATRRTHKFTQRGVVAALKVAA